jgi:general secretion pathway protein I
VTAITARQQLASKGKGFTLIEVLVALAMVAIALAAGARASYALTDNVSRQSNLLMAQLCAENEIIKIRLSRQMPNVGNSTANCEQAGRSLPVNVTVSPTPNAEFRRVNVSVAQADGFTILQLSTVVSGR